MAWLRNCFAFQTGSPGHHLAILSQLTFPVPGRYCFAGSALDSQPLDLGNILAALAPLTFGVESGRRDGVCILPMETEALSNAINPEDQVIDCVWALASAANDDYGGPGSTAIGFYSSVIPTVGRGPTLSAFELMI